MAFIFINKKKWINWCTIETFTTIDNGIVPFTESLSECCLVKKIDFIGFNGNNITDEGLMFSIYKSLKWFNSPVLNMNNSINIPSIFYGCDSSKKLNLSNFNSHKVTIVNANFYGRISLEEAYVAGFGTDNVAPLTCVFSGCESSKEINLMKYNANKVTFIYCIDYVNKSDFLTRHCRLFEELNTFDTIKIAIPRILHGCSKKLISNFKANNKIVILICLLIIIVFF